MIAEFAVLKHHLRNVVKHAEKVSSNSSISPELSHHFAFQLPMELCA